MKILIDNGHGRETVGKRSPDGRLLEWSYNREIARRVNAELQQRGFYSSLLVSEDEDIPLSERCKRVNRVMKPKKKQKKLRITEVDFMLANRRAARMEEISEHGRPVSMRRRSTNRRRSMTASV